ncbi:hypothetical protein AJ80_01309 [Polytolypa hystricis UAMH7299]|uniref:Uncharacterized protein n=1 Tax=Polytolypa hystricis (strain UAMH7299) TaxID=1447883 RepID=A0A2B7Z1C6_POLH7|nr:hypothetical protein AJ80_01309 [Polytolypa hystricis UAMH7299]
MPSISYWRWKFLAAELLESRAISAYQYLPPGHYCTVTYPAKVKKARKLYTVYSRASISRHEGPLYSITASIWDSFGETSLISATFIVPSRGPEPSLDGFRAEWVSDLGLYLVVPTVADKAIEKGPSRYQSTPRRTMASINKQSTDTTDIDALFDIEYPQAKVDNIWEGDSQFDLGLFAVRDIVAPSLTINANSDTSPEPTGQEHINLLGLLKPDVFSWEDDFDEESDISQSSQSTGREERKSQSDVTETHLLKPEKFDWADEFDDDDNMDRETVNDVIKMSTLPAKPYDEDLISARLLESTIDDPFNIDPSLFEYVSLEDIAAMDELVDGREVHDSVAPLDSSDQSTDTDSTGEQSDTGEIDISWQTDIVVRYPTIHHFNWMGEAVLERNYTPPEVSLFVISSKPKRYMVDREVTRKGTVLKQAMRLVDPVMYTGECRDLTLTGHSLLKAVTGQAYQFYTGAGTWRYDDHDSEDGEVALDLSNPAAYLSGTCLPVNGWVINHFAPTRSEYISEAYKLLDEANSRRRCHRKLYQKSPLRKCIDAGSCDGVQYAEPEKVRFFQGAMQYWVDERVVNAAASDCQVSNGASQLESRPASVTRSTSDSGLGKDDSNSASNLQQPIITRRSSDPGLKSGCRQPAMRSQSCPPRVPGGDILSQPSPGGSRQDVEPDLLEPKPACSSTQSIDGVLAASLCETETSSTLAAPPVPEQSQDPPTSEPTEDTSQPGPTIPAPQPSHSQTRRRSRMKRALVSRLRLRASRSVGSKSSTTIDATSSLKDLKPSKSSWRKKVKKMVISGLSAMGPWPIF